MPSNDRVEADPFHLFLLETNNATSSNEIHIMHATTLKFNGTATDPPLCASAAMEVIVQYEKKRSEFGHHCAFEDSPARILESTVSR